MKEAAATLALMAECLGDGFRPLGYMLLPAMIDVTASGNKVISGYVHEAVKAILSHSHVKNGVPIVLEHARSKNGTVRDACFEYLRIILENFDTSRVEPHGKAILEAVRCGVADSSEQSRSLSRQCFPFLLAHFPTATEK